MNRSRLTTPLAICVASCWVFASINSIVLNRPLPAELVTPVMLIVVGAYMARGNGHGNGKDKQ